jgi:hypothetical protein
MPKKAINKKISEDPLCEASENQRAIVKSKASFSKMCSHTQVGRTYFLGSTSVQM